MPCKCSSADKELNNFLLKKTDVETVFDRVPHPNSKCSFGQKGICCRLCSNGPCRITGKTPVGVCGASADVIAARNFLRSVAAGAACYLHIVENAANNLKGIVTRDGVGALKGYNRLKELAEMLGVGSTDPADQAVNIADKILEDIYLPRHKKMELVEALAYKARFNKWQALDILPGGAKSEVFDALVKTSTNLSSDPVNMLLHTLRLGIATGLYGLTLTNFLNDIILGEPEIRKAAVGFKVVKPEYINIMVTGHQQSMLKDLQELLSSDWAKSLAKEAGAEGFKIIGSTCVGQDIQLRANHCEEVFAGHTGNNFTSEALLATGAVDLVVSEFNCTIPGIEKLCDKFNIQQICLDDVAKKQNARYLPFNIDSSKEISREIINTAVKSYKERRISIPIDIPGHGYDDAVTGLTEKSLKGFLGDSYQPLIELLAAGKIKGTAAVVGCSNMTAKGHDIFTVELTKELIKRDILVLSAGCTSGGLENCGLMSPGAAELAGDNLKAVCRQLGIPPVLNFGPCLSIGRLEMVAAELAESLNVDIPQLPLVLSAPQWLEEQALADGAFGLALGLPLHLAIPPFVTGSDLVTEVLTKEMKNLTGGQVIVEGEIKPAADALENIIIEKRSALGI